MKRIDLRALFASRRNKVIAGVVAVLLLAVGFFVFRALRDKPQPSVQAPQEITGKQDLKEAHDFLENLEDEDSQTTDDLVELDKQL